jgi:hypothetical protein
MTQIVERPFPFGKLRVRVSPAGSRYAHAGKAAQFDYIDTTKAASERIYP